MTRLADFVTAKLISLGSFMPVKSIAQRAYMAMIAKGQIKKPGLSKSTAQEFLDATPKGLKLPKHVTPKKK